MSAWPTIEWLPREEAEAIMRELERLKAQIKKAAWILRNDLYSVRASNALEVLENDPCA